MTRPLFLAASLFLFSGIAQAQRPTDPCHTKSRQMTLVKNCYTGDMERPVDGGARFFGASQANSKGASYCYNSLITVEHRTGQGLAHVRVLKDGKDGQFHAYDFALSIDELLKMKKDVPLLDLNGLKGNCFSPTGDKEACNGGFLKTIGLKDTNAPLIVAIGKAANGQFTVSHLTNDSDEIEAHKPKVLEGVVLQDTALVTEKLLQEIRRKLTSTARTKMATLHTGNTSPKKMAEASEQFRYCSLAFENFLKFQKLNDPFSPDEKMTLATLTNYMNGDSGLPQSSRAPSSVPKRKNTQ